ncbi:hypothetical protein LTR22_000942 [Elasticomyces elasticus]|nr:hypothetical protein LTR22_000942 [Elasticomyces elasticus]KAK5769419.1 hypothetical protein LTS12_000346 [Elasticomyces elasticus]
MPFYFSDWKPWSALSTRQSSIVLLIAILSAISVRHFVFEAEDPNKCRPLIDGEHWYDDRTWLVPGCVMEGYDAQKVHACASGRKIVFAGDAQNQGVYWAMVRKLKGEDPGWGPVEQDLHFSDNDVELLYLWDPYLNRSDVHKLAEAYGHESKDAPTLMVIGAGTGHSDVEAVITAVDDLAFVANVGRTGARVGSNFTISQGPGNLFLVAPPPKPVDGTVDATQAISTQLKQRSDKRVLDVLWSFDDTHQIAASGSEDMGRAYRKQADMLLNLRCNARITSGRTWTNIRTCCSVWRRPNWIQSSLISSGFVVLPILVLLDWKLSVLAARHQTALRATCVFLAILSLQYVTDRTHVFEQAARLPLQLPNLLTMICLIVLIGIVSVRRSTPAKRVTVGGKEPDQPFLPRDQSDEWKGWMQALIIVYHYNMAWTALWFWEIIRLAVAGYLFLTGFGHTVYFLQKQDYSFKRVVAVMIRTNLLPVALAYLMRTRWLLYYYMPLSSFWFLVVYATMAVGSSYNKYTPFLLGKIVASAALVRAFINTKDLPETLVRLFTLTCKMNFDAKEFFGHRVRIDEFIVYVGMLVAILYVWSKDVLASESPHGRLAGLYRRYFPYLKLAAVASAATGFAGFWYAVHLKIRRDSDWTAWQPYDTFIPILAFLILRNAYARFRNYHSAAFAWLGRYSGEMYVMQDHIWLAGDQEAVLRTGLFHGNDTVFGDRWRDLLIITPLYLIACCIIGDATQAITVWFTAEGKPVAARPADVPDEVEMGLLDDVDGQRNTNEKIAPPARLWHRFRISWWPNKVRDRALLLLAVLWFLNMTYH